MSSKPHRGRRIAGAEVETFLQEHWLLIVVFAIGIAVRLYEFGSVPPGLNQDEASTGYEAFALLHHGIDRHGFHNPVMLVSWGSGAYALPSYLAMPFYLLFGFSVASLRGVNLLGGILSLPAFYLLVRQTGDKTLALLATFLLAISPWHIMMSRWALDTNLLPALFLFAVLFLCRPRQTTQSLLWAAVFFALTLYAFGTAYLVTPLFLLLALLFFRRHPPPSWKPIMQAGALFFILALPIVLFVVVNQFKLGSITTPFMSIPRLTGIPRFKTVSIFFGGHGASALWDNLHGSWRLLASGNDGLIFNEVPGFAYLYALGLPLSVLGVIIHISRRRFQSSRTEFFLLAWLGAAVALTATEVPTTERMNIIFLPLIYFAAVGIRAIAVSKPLLVAIVAYFCIVFVQFTHTYFGSYPAQASGAFFEHFGDAINEAATATSGPICITDRVEQPYIFVLFYRKIDPHVFVQTAVYEDSGAEFEHVSSFDRYTFGLARCNPATTQAYVADVTEAQAINPARFATNQIGRYVVGLRR
jgi:hypothetical protein